MSFLKKIFSKEEEPIDLYKEFWNWFVANEKNFFDVVKNQGDFEKDFFDKLSLKLSEIREGFLFLAGMMNENTAELIITPDGILKNIVFVEELIAAAPDLKNWKFTALKQAMDINHVAIRMADFTFDSENLSFVAVDHKDYPDEIDLVLVHNDYSEENKSTIINGTYIFIDNYLGELNSLTTIDNVTFASKEEVKEALIPIAKLKDFLIWREKEFVEKYSGIRYNTDSDSYSSLEAELKNGRPLIAIVNSTLLQWDSKASHPWILRMELNYDGDSNNGMPGKEDYDLMNTFEDELLLTLKDSEGYLNIGRQTADNVREIYFACKNFRLPSKAADAILKKYDGQVNGDFYIYKDKYWQSFEKFRT